MTEKKSPRDERDILPVTRTGEEARESYNRMSRYYDLLTGSTERKLRQAGMELFKPEEGEKLLELGFGTGLSLVPIAESVGSTGMVAGIDISDGMVEKAGERLRKEGLRGRVRLDRGDARDMPYEDGRFNGVFASFTLELFPAEEIPVVVSECLRVLKRSGRLCVVSMSNQGKSSAMEKLYIWSHRKFPRYIDCRPINAKGFVKDAGFEIRDSRMLSDWGLPVDIVLGVKP